jgi:hypothetical protein
MVMERAVDKSITICIPTRDMVNSGFAIDLAMLATRAYSDIAPGYKFNVSMISGTLIADQRTKLAQMAIESRSDYILFLDSDMRFPSDLLSEMVKHDKDIVACNYTTRRAPIKTVAFSDFASLQCIYSYGKSGLEEVDAVGMGAMLIKTEVFRKIPMPWFNISYLPSGKIYIGEDIYFCKLAQSHGYTVYIDHTLSQRVGHTGSVDYWHKDTEYQKVTAEMEKAHEEV